MTRRTTTAAAAPRRALLAALALAAACQPAGKQQPAGAGVSQVPDAEQPQVSYVLRAPEGPAPGLQVSRVQSQVRNPYDGDMGGIEEGRFLYVRMNCAYCHGFDGTGGMGPDLTDKQWRYGGSDVDIFNSIYSGRAKGMPAWGPLLPENQIWQLAAYVRSLSQPHGSRYTSGPGGRDETRKTAPNTTIR